MSRYLVVVELCDTSQKHHHLYSKGELQRRLKLLKADPEVENLIVYKDPKVQTIWVSPDCKPEQPFT